jgi:flagellar biosynthesis/type III secretory pathway protein FliH
VASIISLLAKLDHTAPAIEWVKVIFRYILDVMDISAEELYNLTTSLPEPTKEVTMSLAEKIRLKGIEEGRIQGLEEGFEKGKIKGLIEGKVRVLRRLLSKRFGLDILPSDIEIRLQNATEAELDIYAERILEAKTLEEIFGERNQ